MPPKDDTTTEDLELEEKDPANEDDEEDKEEDEGDGEGEKPQGDEGEDDSAKKRKEHLANLEAAIEEETQKIEEKTNELRRLRERRRSLSGELGIEADKPESKKNDDDDKDKPPEVKLREQIKRELREEEQRENLEAAKRRFYKTALGKKYDPINDPDGRLWRGMEDFFHLTPRDISEERIVSKLVAAALGHEQDKVLGGEAEYQRNLRAAKETLEDMGTGKLALGRQQQDARKGEDETLSAKEKQVAARMGVTEKQYLAAKRKVQADLTSR